MTRHKDKNLVKESETIYNKVYTITDNTEIKQSSFSHLTCSEIAQVLFITLFRITANLEDRSDEIMHAVLLKISRFIPKFKLMQEMNEHEQILE